MTKLFQGLSAAPGVGIGNLLIYRTWHLATLTMPETLAADPQQEWQQFWAAQQIVDDELAALATSENLLIAEVFMAQRVILQDQTFTHAMQQAIFHDHLPVLTATQKVIHHLAELFRNLGDDYFAGRAVDILDIGQRLLHQLGMPIYEQQQTEQIPAGTILVARDITFSEITQLPLAHIVGIVLAESTPTAHSAILARSLGIPMLCTMGEAILQLPAYHPALIDGTAGYLLVEPTAAELTAGRAKRQAQADDRASAVARVHEPAYTQDGQLVPVLANANNPEDVSQVCVRGADGIGLLRTEYLFENRLELPTFEEQYETYRHFALQLSGLPVTVRALDIGGDKPMPYLIQSQEANPFLGLRGIRLLLAKPELLIPQYQALWQIATEMASGLLPHCDLRFMLPMISTVEEVRAVRALLANVEAEARPRLSTNVDASVNPQTASIKIGVMIEVPSAALMAARIAPLVDFFSIGTNDLAQYTLATDRTNSNVAAMADPLHPAVLSLMQRTCQAGTAAGIPVSICGEIGGDPDAVPLLLGLGLHELSAPVPAVPLVKEAVRRSSQAACCALAEQALQCEDAGAVRALLGYPR